jgi:uncharacterized protein (DUF2126 family)
LRAKAAVEYETTHRGDRTTDQRGVDVYRKVDFPAGSAGQRVDETLALFVAQWARTPHLSANAAGRFIGQQIVFAVDRIKRDQASLIDQIGKEISDRLASAPLLANALQYLPPLVNRVQRLKESPLEVRVGGEQSSHVVELSADRCDSALFLGQREESARVTASGFALHG